MNLHVVAYLVGKICVTLSLAIILPLFLGILYGELVVKDFLYTFLMTISLGHMLKLWGGKGDIQNVTIREGIAIVGFTWFISAFLCAVPFYVHGILDVNSAFFESMSGLTTTGATVIEDLEKLPKSLLFWRSMTHWIGGIGIIVLFVALLPQLGNSAFNMVNAEVSGFSSSRIKPRIRNTAMMLLYIYVGMTILCTIALMVVGMNWYDAVNHAFSAIATGGFSTYNASVAYFNSVSIEVVLSIFMILAGANFSLYYQLFQSGPKCFLQDVEFKAYLGYLAILTILITINIYIVNGYELGTALRHASFQVTSFASTTGYVSFDYDQWPSFSKLLLAITYIVGGCAGSTAGGVKVCRFVVLLKTVGAEMRRALHPNMLLDVYYGGKHLDIPTILNISRFFFLYILILVVLAGIATLGGMPFDESIFGVASCISSVGPAFGSIGATGNFAGLHPVAKFAMAMAMLLGRLELFTILALLRKDYWRRTSRW